MSDRSAAATLGLGDLLPDVHEFYSRIRRRLRREDVRIRVRTELPREDWAVVRGLPVTTARKIVTDLLHDREDEYAVARTVQDALRAELLTQPSWRTSPAVTLPPMARRQAPLWATALAGVTSGSKIG